MNSDDLAWMIVVVTLIVAITAYNMLGEWIDYKKSRDD